MGYFIQTSEASRLLAFGICRRLTLALALIAALSGARSFGAGDGMISGSAMYAVLGTRINSTQYSSREYMTILFGYMARWLFFFLGVVAPIRAANLFGVVSLTEEDDGVQWKQASLATDLSCG
jgi:hypothetical protein